MKTDITKEKKEFVDKISSIQEDKDTRANIWWL